MAPLTARQPLSLLSLRLQVFYPPRLGVHSLGTRSSSASAAPRRRRTALRASIGGGAFGARRASGYFDSALSEGRQPSATELRSAARDAGPAAAMFLRHTQLFLWKNSLQKARNPGQTCCELLTPVILVALFALLCVCRAAVLFAAAPHGRGRRGHPSPAADSPSQVQVRQPEHDAGHDIRVLARAHVWRCVSSRLRPLPRRAPLLSLSYAPTLLLPPRRSQVRLCVPAARAECVAADAGRGRHANWVARGRLYGLAQCDVPRAD